jgi:undecaprenyl-diphosphatase
MSWIEALILGILQGITEFLPISSSGHLELGEAILGTHVEDNLTFTVVVHVATVCSTIVVFYKDIRKMLVNSFSLKINDDHLYILNIIISCIPVIIVGLLFEKEVEQFFNNKLSFVGFMLLITAALLAFTYYAKEKDKNISASNAFIIGIAQALAVLPGISRSGATIATGLLLGNRKADIAKFSFLMVLLPILGKLGMDVISGKLGHSSLGTEILITGFLGAFISGLIACKLMIAIVKRSKLIYFAIYCAVIGILAIILG